MAPTNSHPVVLRYIVADSPSLINLTHLISPVLRLATRCGISFSRYRDSKNTKGATAVVAVLLAESRQRTRTSINLQSSPASVTFQDELQLGSNSARRATPFLDDRVAISLCEVVSHGLAGFLCLMGCVVAAAECIGEVKRRRLARMFSRLVAVRSCTLLVPNSTLRARASCNRWYKLSLRRIETWQKRRTLLTS